MSYEVLARKWRPRQFDDVVGQDHVVRTLQNAIETERLAHAYLFVGPRGIGKTSIARIFAKALNCAEGPTTMPCDACDACREIAAGTNLDVLEIDGASNNSVEQVRDLRDTVKFAPVRGAYKIYIIDEVHMLSTAAFNALLKTLEEPPPHVKFIFATTEPDKVLATIVSRCQRFDLRRIPVDLIIERLRLVAEDEGIAIDDDALLAVARGAEGGMRDAESALDQLISFKGKSIAEEDVLSVFGLVSRVMLEEMAGHILAGEVAPLVTRVAELEEAGKDLQRLVVELMGYFRNLLICLYTDGDPKALDVAEAQRDVLRQQGATTSAGRVMRIVSILTDSEQRIKYALSKRTLLDTTLIRCARAADTATLEEVLEKLNALGAAPRPPADKAAAAPAAGTGRVVAHSKRPAYTAVKPAEPPDAERELALLQEQWPKIAARVGRMAPLARTAMRDARPLSLEGDCLVVGCNAEFADEIEKLQSGRNHAALERAVKDVLRRPLRVEVTADESAAEQVPGGGEGGRGADAAAAEPEMRVEPEAAPPAPSAERAGEGAGKTVQEWARDPVVRKALDLFDGAILEVRD